MQNRQHTRVDVELKTVYHDQIDVDETDALMSNLSFGGCCIATNRPLEQGSMVRFSFRLPGIDRQVICKGKVCWVQDPDPAAGSAQVTGAMGIQFLEIKDEDLMALKRFIEEQASSSLFS